MKTYNPHEIEPRIQKQWEEQEIDKTCEDPSKPKRYVLEMFPYPSGDIHMGHVRNYSIGDVIARYLKMKGFDVLHPMGWDAFGLPAENAAIKNNSHPSTWTYENIETQKQSFKRLGFSYDWDRTCVTADPEYYRWGQWFFLKMLERGLVERKDNPVNWCEKCKTVLANEQVKEGECWRCHSAVEKRQQTQWYFKITDYAEELLKDLDKLDQWPSRVRQMQANWIGKSEGAEVDFKLVPLDGEAEQSFTVFTTRPDTLFGCTFFLLAPEYNGLDELIAGSEYEDAVHELVAASLKVSAVDRAKGNREKHGVFTGRYVTNPINGEEVQVWVADYIVSDYGTGAVMAVPCSDQRDFEFAKKYELPIIPIILDKNDPMYEDLADVKERKITSVDWEEAYEAEGILVQSGEFTGLVGGKHSPAKDAIIAKLEAEGSGRRKTEYRLRDWLISRQRYWGNPIPIIHCPECGIVPVPEEDLPVMLSKDIDLAAGETLASMDCFKNCICQKCGKPAQRETDTMDTFTCSSWYYLRYADPHNDQLPFAKGCVDRWLPVDRYIGGIEHAIMHLLYSRFYTKVFRDMDFLGFDEPFDNLLCQGMVKDKNGETMSKSKGNVVVPEDVISGYGADATRTYILFMAPPDKDLNWDEAGLAGTLKFLNRVWRIVHDLAGKADDKTFFAMKASAEEVDKATKTLLCERHRCVAKVTCDFERNNLNTALSGIMELCNAAANYLKIASSEERLGDSETKAFSLGVAEVITKTLAPYAPHITEELWQKVLDNDDSVHQQSWPEFDLEKTKADKVELVVQILGKIKARIMVPQGAANKEIENIALRAAEEHIAGKTIRKVIVVPNRLVNIVVN
ncbi:MAG: leucine--tRNA ligase [Eggerthellaceae bacterium]|nr:leucine--tRNA ligase [Eggerthellaceae bacterium]